MSSKEKDYTGNLKGHPVRVQVKYDKGGNVIKGKMTSLPPEIKARIKKGGGE